MPPELSPYTIDRSTAESIEETLPEEWYLDDQHEASKGATQLTFFDHDDHSGSIIVNETHGTNGITVTISYTRTGNDDPNRADQQSLDVAGSADDLRAWTEDAVAEAAETTDEEIQKNLLLTKLDRIVSNHRDADDFLSALEGDWEIDASTTLFVALEEKPAYPDLPAATLFLEQYDSKVPDTASRSDRDECEAVLNVIQQGSSHSTHIRKDKCQTILDLAERAIAFSEIHTSYVTAFR